MWAIEFDFFRRRPGPFSEPREGEVSSAIALASLVRVSVDRLVAERGVVGKSWEESNHRTRSNIRCLAQESGLLILHLVGGRRKDVIFGRFLIDTIRCRVCALVVPRELPWGTAFLAVYQALRCIVCMRGDYSGY